MLELKAYNLLGELNDEQDLLESFISDYKHTTYVGDAITEAADSYIPVYNSDVWKNAADIQEYIEEAIASGIAGVEGGDIDLIRIFQAGYYQYYSQSLYNNLDEMVYNHIVEEVNNYLNELDEMLISELDLDAIEEHIEDEAGDFDNNNQMSILDDIIEGTKELIDEQIEELEEEE